MLIPLLAAVLASPTLPPQCAPPAAREVTGLADLAKRSGALSVGLDSVATWCFESSGTWTGGQPVKKGKQPDPQAAPAGDCAKAIGSCEGAKVAIREELRQLLYDTLGEIDTPYLGVKYTPKRSGLAERPPEVSDCRSKNRAELFSQAQARMDLARLANQAQSEYRNYRTWLYKEGLVCAQLVAQGQTDLTRRGVAVDAPVEKGGGKLQVDAGYAAGAGKSGAGTVVVVAGAASGGTAGGATSGGTPSAGGASGTSPGASGTAGGATSGGIANAGGASGTSSAASGAAGGAATAGAPKSGGASGTAAGGTPSATGASGGGAGSTGSSAGGAGAPTPGAGAATAAVAVAAVSGAQGGTGSMPSGAGASGTPSSAGAGTSGARGGSGSTTSPGATSNGSGAAGTQGAVAAGAGGVAVASAGSNAAAKDIPLGGPTQERQKALASSMIVKWRYLADQRLRMEPDPDWALGFLVSRELQKCHCLRVEPKDVVVRLETGDRVAALQADDEKNTRCELCLQDSYGPWKARVQKQCGQMDDFTDYELGVLQRSEDGHGLPPRCFEASRARRAARPPVAAAAPATASTAGRGGTAFIITKSPESTPVAQGGGSEKPTDYAPVPPREEGHLYYRVFMSRACEAEVEPGPISVRTGDLMPVPPGTSALVVKSPCGGLVELYVGKEVKPRLTEMFAKGQPLRLQLKKP